jgi:hypothetical protein
VSRYQRHKRWSVSFVKINQIASLIKVSILKATHREPVGSDRRVHADKATMKVQEAREVANRTGAIVAVDAHIDEQTITIVTVAGHWQF